MKPILVAAFSFLVLASLSVGQSEPAVPMPKSEVLGIGMEGYDYPAPVQYLPLREQGQDLRMAYMDVNPAGAKGVIFLLHGKNFFGAYWKGPVELLAQAGYRVVVPDQIGFGKSSKPTIDYSFDLLARNTITLADELKIPKFTVLGHSMGGMLAMRLARAYPDRVERMILENPIGLEDYQQLVPAQSLETVYQNELNQSSDAYRAYVSNYFVNKAPMLIDPFVAIKSAIMKSPEFPRWAMSSALTYQMIVQQPTVYDLANISCPSLLIIGQSDRTAVGANYATLENKGKLGNYPELGRRAQRALANAKLVEIANCGHIPHLEDPNAFKEALMNFLGR